MNRVHWWQKTSATPKLDLQLCIIHIHIFIHHTLYGVRSFRDFPPDSIPRVVASSRQRGGGSHEHDTHHIYTLFFQMPISFTSSFEPPLNIIGIYVERSLLRDFGCTFTMKTVWIRFQTFAALPGLVVCFALFRKGLSSSPLLWFVLSLTQVTLLLCNKT